MDKNTKTALVCKATNVVEIVGKGPMECDSCNLIDLDAIGAAAKVGGTIVDGVYTPPVDPNKDRIDALKAIDASSIIDPTLKTVVEYLQIKQN